jgi:hypothetical protein
MTEDFGLAILYLTALAAYLSLAWQIWCAGRWLWRRLWPTFSEQVDARFKPYLRQPCKLWAEDVEKAVQIRAYHSPGKRRTTASPTTDSSSDAQEAEPMTAPILAFSRLAPSTTATSPAGRRSPFAVRQGASSDGEKTPVSDAPETG